jgi:uncharacterized protein (DUF433 family)
MPTIQGVIHGKTIELESAPGFPDGQPVSVDIRPTPRQASSPQPALPWWLERLDIDPAVSRGKFVVKGTRVLADSLVDELTVGRSDQELLQMHPELTQNDLDAMREYADVPTAMRRSFGACADEAEDLDRYIELTRQDRHATRREIEN